MGNAFPIEEEPFQKMIKKRLEYMSKEEMIDINELIMKEFHERPRYIILPKAKRDKEFPFNPTYILEDDMHIPSGKLIYKKGQEVNPLNHVEFDRILYFIDGNDPAQVKWFQSQLTSRHRKEQRLIIAQGSRDKIVSKLGKQVYVDQHGELITKFKILALPAMVWQNSGEKYLRVKEVLLP